MFLQRFCLFWLIYPINKLAAHVRPFSQFVQVTNSNFTEWIYERKRDTAYHIRTCQDLSLNITTCQVLLCQMLFYAISFKSNKKLMQLMSFSKIQMSDVMTIFQHCQNYVLKYASMKKFKLLSWYVGYP